MTLMDIRAKGLKCGRRYHQNFVSFYYNHFLSFPFLSFIHAKEELNQLVSERPARRASIAPLPIGVGSIRHLVSQSGILTP